MCCFLSALGSKGTVTISEGCVKALARGAGCPAETTNTGHPYSRAVSKQSRAFFLFFWLVWGFYDFDDVVQRVVVGFVTVFTVTTQTKSNCSHDNLNATNGKVVTVDKVPAVANAPLTPLSVQPVWFVISLLNRCNDGEGIKVPDDLNWFVAAAP